MQITKAKEMKIDGNPTEEAKDAGEESLAQRHISGAAESSDAVWIGHVDPRHELLIHSLHLYHVFPHLCLIAVMQIRGEGQAKGWKQHAPQGHHFRAAVLIITKI